MNIVKLDAINSTNQFIKDHLKNQKLESRTVFTAEYQTEGRGQMHTSWESEPGKNLLFSIYLEFSDFYTDQQFYLTCAVSLGIIDFLDKLKIDKLSIKWPNDIMAGDKKIAGMLIENTFISNTIKNSIVGIGLNVNQTRFQEYETPAVSLINLLEKKLDRNRVLHEVLEHIFNYLDMLENKDFKQLKQLYDSRLYQKDIVKEYRDASGSVFRAKILGVNKQGKLLVEQEDNELKIYDFKEIRFL